MMLRSNLPKYSVTAACIALGIIAVSTVADAGLKQNVEVVVDTGLKIAYGVVGDARDSADAFQYIGCASDGAMVSCNAQDKNSVSAACLSIDPKHLAVANSIGSNSGIQFDWDAAGNCTSLFVANGSKYRPVSPDGCGGGSGGAPGTLRVQYLVQSGASNEIKAKFNIVNDGATPVALSTLTLRYWYTKDSGASQVGICDYAGIGTGNVVYSFTAVAPPRTGADNYVEATFKPAAGNLAPGDETHEIQMRLHKTDWSNYNQSNDYSYDPTKTTFTNWSKVTLYQSGILVWGTEP